MPNIRLVTFAGETVTPLDDALVYQTAVSDSGIIYGATVTQADSSTLHITAGYGIASGRFFEIYDADIIIPLSPSGTLKGQLYVHMDLGSALSPIDILYETASSLTPMQQDANVNVVNGVYEIQLATFDVNTTTISNLAYTAPIVAGSGGNLIATTENSNKASRAYAVGDYMIWNKTLYRVKTAMAKNATITLSKLTATMVATELKATNTALGGFSFGYTTDNKPGYKAPGADAVVPFSGLFELGTLTNVTLPGTQSVVLAQNVDLSEFRYLGLIINTKKGQHPYACVSLIVGNVMSAFTQLGITQDGQDTRDAAGSFSMFLPVDSTATVNVTLQNVQRYGTYTAEIESVTLFGIR